MMFTTGFAKPFDDTCKKEIIVVSPIAKPPYYCEVFYLHAGALKSVYSVMTSQEFIETFLNEQGTSIRGSKHSMRNLTSFAKKVPFYAPKTQQVIHEYTVYDAIDPLYIFTTKYQFEEISKKRCILYVAEQQFYVKASAFQCREQCLRATYVANLF